MRLQSILLSLFALSLAAYGQKAPTESDLYVRVRIGDEIKTAKLKPGDVVEGKLFTDVYSGTKDIFPAGSTVRLAVDRLERARRIPNDHWPWVIQAFTPRHQNSPKFRSATVVAANGAEIPLQVSLISIRRERTVAIESQKPAKGQKPAVSQIVTMQATLAGGETKAAPAAASGSTTPEEAVTLEAGTKGKVILLGNLSAGKSRAGDAFQARVIEPVRVDTHVVVPEGTVLEGRVAKRTPPRWLSRSGSLLLAFTGLTLPGGTTAPAEASITEAELDQRSHTRIDPEGVMHGERPGKAWMAINLAVTGGIAKEVDDGTQLVIEAVVSTATDMSTAGAARIAGTCASALFLVTRHGRDVVLPQFTELKVVFNRPLTLPGATASAPNEASRPELPAAPPAVN